MCSSFVETSPVMSSPVFLYFPVLQEERSEEKEKNGDLINPGDFLAPCSDKIVFISERRLPTCRKTIPVFYI